MNLGIFDATVGDGGTIDDIVASAASAQQDGFASWWQPQIFGFETLTLLAIVGREVPDIALGTAVVPIYPRHPVTMAAEAFTAQAAARGNRLTLGIGLSHQMVIESMFGMSYARPAHYMGEYLAALMPLLSERSVSVSGDAVSVSAGLQFPDDVSAPSVLVAALGPKMLDLAGRLTDGTVTWMTGPKTLESHIVPSIRAAAASAGRPEPRVVACLPTCVTDDPEGERSRVAKVFEIYGFLPSYRAVLDREGAAGPADVAIVGDEDSVRTQIEALRAIGVSEFVAVDYSSDPERKARTRDLLRTLL